MLLLLLVVLAAAPSAAYTCPSYDSIRQPSVAAGHFNNSQWAAGPWYVQATNEAAVPSSSLLHCPCNVYHDISLPSAASGRHPRGPDSYSMRYTAACGDRVLGFHNLTVPLEGFWNDSSTPGYHYENYVGARDFGPTMIYDVALGNDGVSYEWCAVYACEGPPVQRKVGYSWQLLSRRRSVPGLQAIVEHWVERARKLGLDLQGLHYANWDDCGSWKDGRNDEG